MPHTDMSAPSAHGSFKPAFKPVTITPEELDACSDSHPQGSFQQTTAMMEVARSRVDSFDMVGIRDENGTLVAGCFIAYTRGRFGLEGSVWLGPLCDPHDVPMLKAMTGCISDSARRHGAMSVTCWPNLVYQRHDSQGAPEGEPDAAALHAYESLGWRHAGFGQGYGSVVNQWVYVKDLTGIADEKALLKSYDKRTQWSVKRAQSMGVTVRELGIDELQSFADIETATAQRRHFQDRGIAYFRQFKQAFGDKALIGAGTVLQPEQVDELAKMGCKLIVTPNINPEVIRRAVDYGMTVCPGCATATEAFAALDAGAQSLKIFPSSAFGPDYIKALKAVLPASVPVFAVGGVTPENLGQWMNAGCVGAGLGSDLYRAGQPVERTAQQAAAFVKAYREAVQ